MNIEFTAKTNKSYCMINTVTFRLPEGTTLTIDREITDYSIEDGELSMVWEHCYIWEINGVNIFDREFPLNSDAASLLETAELICVDLEDDADPDYYVRDIRFSV